MNGLNTWIPSTDIKLRDKCIILTYDPNGIVSRGWSSATTDTPDKRYRFGGKEITGTVSNATSTGADKYLDFGARLYNPRTAIWLSQDPMAEKYYPMSPYEYCFNNPVAFIDPDGKDGYYGSNGEYRWFSNLSTSSFCDDQMIEWAWVTGDWNAWTEAITIREANIEALIELGNDPQQVTQDVHLFPADSGLFTKESQLLNYDTYIKGWENAFNSMRKDAWQSKSIGNSGYKLKYYPQKGNGENDLNAIGLIKSSIAEHFIEAGLEKIESIIFGERAVKDPVSDMHTTNANGFLRWKGLK